MTFRIKSGVQFSVQDHQIWTRNTRNMVFWDFLKNNLTPRCWGVPRYFWFFWHFYVGHTYIFQIWKKILGYSTLLLSINSSWLTHRGQEQNLGLMNLPMTSVTVWITGATVGTTPNVQSSQITEFGKTGLSGPQTLKLHMEGANGIRLTGKKKLKPYGLWPQIFLFWPLSQAP